MKDLFQSLFLQLKDATGPTRTVIGVGILLVLVIISGATYMSMNPNMVILYTNLPKANAHKVTQALADAGLRFMTSNPPGPYTISVAKPDYQSAVRAVHSEGAMVGAPEGIDTGTGGAASVFMGEAERQQVAQKRLWQEAENQLESIDWISSAKCMSSPPKPFALQRRGEDTVSVVLTIHGTYSPDRGQRKAAANIVRNTFGVPMDNVVIVDNSMNVIFDGGQDSGLDENLAFEEQFDRAKTERAQRFLDDTFGPGLTRVSVAGEFGYLKTERFAEEVGQAKNLLSKDTRKTKTPGASGPVAGGPVSTSLPDQDASAASLTPDPATTNETNERYAPSREYVHTRQDKPKLEHMSISLVLDESLVDLLAAAEESIKGVVGYIDGRDSIVSHTQLLHGIERDEQGLPVVAALVEPAEDPLSPTVLMLIEHGVEIVAALAFIVLLLKGMRKGNVKIEIKQPKNQIDDLPDEEIDMDALARRHVEDLLDKDPDRVGALLSRWAMGDEYYASSTE